MIITSSNRNNTGKTCGNASLIVKRGIYPTPGNHSAISFQSDTKYAADCNGLNSSEANGNGGVSIVNPTPGYHGTIGFKREIVILARGNTGDIGQTSRNI